jgi:NFU1 iron-sulfur cluster scaffold homolog, mitochondrial
MKATEQIESEIISCLDEIRTYLQQDGGDVEFVRFDVEAFVAEVRLIGTCAVCPLSIMTLRAGIERFLIHRIPEIKRIEQVH